MQGSIARSRPSGTRNPRVARAPVQTATAEPQTAAACPRCAIALTDPNGLGLCPRCGYCRSLEEAASIRMTDTPSSLEALAPVLVVSWRATRLLPESTWLILLGGLCLLPVSYFADRSLAPNSGERAWWGALQLLFGMVAIFVAQVWAWLLLRQRGEPVGFMDLIFPGQLWRLTFVALPDTGGPLSLGAGGCLAAVTAVLWIGGGWWWLRADPTPDVPRAQAAKAAGHDWRDEYQRLKEATALVANAEPVPNKPATSAKEPPRTAAVDSRPAAQCVVIGYLSNKNGRLAGLVLATLRDGKLSYAGTVTNGFDDEAPRLLKKLASLTTQSPLLADLGVDAVWVRPGLFCDVHQSGYNDKGLLIDPRFKAAIED